MSIETNPRFDSREAALLSMIHTGANLCGYHIPQKCGIFSSDYAARYNIPEVVDDVARLAVMIGLVAPQSADDWFAMFASIDDGIPCGSSKIFMRHLDGQYIRYWMRYTTFPDEEGKPLIALITFDNISKEYAYNLAQSRNISALIQASENSFLEVLTLNVTKGTFCVSSSQDPVAINAQDHPLEDIVRINLNRIVPEDHENVRMTFTTANLRRTFIEEKRESIELVYRRRVGRGAARWHQTTITPLDNPADDDILLVAATRNIDREKAEELRLSNELWLQSEQIRVTTGKLGRTIFYYDIPTKTLTVPAEYALKHNMSIKVANYPDSISLDFRTELPDTYYTIHRFYSAIQQGEPSGSCELCFKPRFGPTKWMRWEYALVNDKKGNPYRAIIFVEDITDQHLQASEIKRLRSNEQFSRIIAQHSDRTIYFFEVPTGVLRLWGEIADSRKVTSAETPVDSLLVSENFKPDNIDILRNMFTDIQAGIPQGGMKVHATTAEDTSRWLDIRFSTIFSDSNLPLSAVISVKDVTEQYEIELTYLRHLQAMQNSEAHLGSVEVDLHSGIIEAQSGRMLPADVVAAGKHMADVASHMLSLRLIHDSDRMDATRFFSTEFLNGQYTLGIRRLERVWQMAFHNGKPGWIHTEVDLVLDPYSQHRKAFFRLTDITEKKTAELEMISRSERDGMTGLLNRATTEERVKAQLAREARPGILVLLDLDDLKVINDTFGHSEGDRAIRSIAETLKLHFREGDIIGRIGGDEFLIYLPGAADNQDAISASISNLLRKLTRMPVGEDNQRRIHCSIGCTMETAGDTFDTIYKRADVALYSVKRSGKNNYAFYTASMEVSNQHFQSQRLLSQRTAKKANITELQYLLTALTDLYEVVMAFNLSTKDYFLLEEDKEGVFSALPSYGVMDDFINLTRIGVHPDDVDAYMDWLTGDALLQAYERGERSVRYYCRFYNEGTYKWVEVDIVFYVNEDGDLCDFTLLRWADERSHELDQLALSKVLELAVNSTFEYVGLIDVRTGLYSKFGANLQGAFPRQRSYDEALRRIQSTISPEEQEAYYESANLSNVTRKLTENDGAHAFRYTLPDGSFQAAYEWLDGTCDKVILTVTRLGDK